MLRLLAKRLEYLTPQDASYSTESEEKVESAEEKRLMSNAEAQVRTHPRWLDGPPPARADLHSLSAEECSSSLGRAYHANGNHETRVHATAVDPLHYTAVRRTGAVTGMFGIMENGRKSDSGRGKNGKIENRQTAFKSVRSFQTIRCNVVTKSV